jgi:L-lactate dehydrogenase complex protein LldG
MFVQNETMLDRVRVALRGSAAPVPLPEPVRFEIVAGEPPVDGFCRELELVGGTSQCIGSTTELKQYIEKLLPPGEPCSVALSNGAGIKQSGLREWLTDRGIEVVPTFSESQSSQKDYVRRLLKARIGVTQADYAVAETGTLVLVSDAEQHRLLSLLPPAHVCLLDPKHIVPTLSCLMARLEERFAAGQIMPRAVTMITGPSRTADIEHTLTTGVHGPVALHVLIQG